MKRNKPSKEKATKDLSKTLQAEARIVFYLMLKLITLSIYKYVFRRPPRTLGAFLVLFYSTL